MVIGPTSVRPGKGQYVWLNDLPIADAPDWLIALVCDGVDMPKANGGDPGLDNLTQLAQDLNSYPPMTLEEVEAAVDAIPVESIVNFKDWNNLCMGVYSAAPNADGLKILDDWCQKSSEYNEQGFKE